MDDSAGWGDLTGRGHDHDQSTIEKIYADALTAWRKNPIAWRIVAITTDFVVGDSITISSPDKALNDFIQRFWNNPQNRMALRLEPMCDELSRAGDLFVALFRNDQDGMSYIRFVTKDQITRIETAPNDWEVERVGDIWAIYGKTFSGEWVDANGDCLAFDTKKEAEDYIKEEIK